MSKIQKRKLLGLLTFTCFLVAILAISLPGLQMLPGIAFPLQLTETGTIGSTQEPEGNRWILLIFQALVIFLSLLLPVYIVISLLRDEGRKELLSNALIITVVLVFILWLSNLNLPLDKSMGQPKFDSLPDQQSDPRPLPIFIADIQPWMLMLIMIAAAMLLTVGIILVKNFLAKRISSEDLPYMEIADNVQSSLADIEQSEAGFDDAIIRCYSEMSRTLQAEKGVQRGQGMTPNEFEQELLAKGFPARPVHRLTKLFEQVRYGRLQTPESQKRVAAACLSEIIDYCQGQR